MTSSNPCPCEAGWRPVTETYARQEAGIPQSADLDTYRLAPVGSDLRDRYASYLARLNSVYPCPSCRPEQLSRWRNGCYRPNHRPCGMCRS